MHMYIVWDDDIDDCRLSSVYLFCILCVRSIIRFVIEIITERQREIERDFELNPGRLPY